MSSAASRSTKQNALQKYRSLRSDSGREAKAVLTMRNMLCLVCLFSFFQAAAAAGDKTHFVYRSIPFLGYYDDNGFHVDPVSMNVEPIDKFILELPKVFPKGSKVNGINRDGKRSVLVIKKVDMGVLLEGDFIVDPPISYRDEQSAELVWTPGRDVEIVKTEVAPVPSKAKEELAQKLGVAIKSESPEFPDGAEKARLLQLARQPPEPVGRKAEDLPDLLFISWEAGAGHFFIYSISRGEFLFAQMSLFSAHDVLSGPSLRPLFFFRVQGNSKTYILAESSDGYEDSVHVVLDAETGETMLATY